MYELSSDDIQNLGLTEAEEKMLYMRYLVKRESQQLKQVRYQYLIDLLEARICLLRQDC